jgi:BirA family biotin operon repressor/biotin-[acetyl-CoA-carboxylase] ligase
MSTPIRQQSERRRKRLLALLANGEFHSGQALARRLSISRGGVWKLIRVLREMGVAIESVERQGYRLPAPVDLLDKRLILDALAPAVRERLDTLDILLTVDSTNRRMVDAKPPEAGCASVCAAEVQNAGRGRRGRSWLAPFGSGVCMSLGWQFAEAPPTFSALSLAVGVAAVKALRRFGAEGVGLKWPNDLVWRERKLGGILIEMRGETTGPAYVVIGIGVNMRMPATARLALAEQQAALVADVNDVLRERRPTRNALIAALTEEFIAMLDVFAQRGFDAFIEEWRALDALAGVSVRVMNGAQTHVGVARGVDADGGLLVDIDGEQRKFVSGEVSLRRSG